MDAHIPLLRAPGLSALPGVVHGFSTRFDADGTRLDLGRNTSEALWSRVCSALGEGVGGVARLHQVHGSTVQQVDTGGAAGEGDALLTTVPGVVLAVRTADCVPVLLAMGDPVIAVAAVHSGWRSTALDIVGETIRALRRLDAQAEIHAVIGPAISGANYEVGEEVVHAITATGVPEDCFVNRPGDRPRPFADIRAAVRWQLERHGAQTIEWVDRCTFADPSLWSHRRDGLSRGSLAGLIGMVDR